MIFALNLCKLRSKIGKFGKNHSPKSLKLIFGTLQQNHKRSILAKAKIMFSFFQIVSLMSRVYTIEYPP
ncbi:hypothetical protein ScalyP_jg575, partial [Parmales sp. scaly parma]